MIDNNWQNGETSDTKGKFVRPTQFQVESAKLELSLKFWHYQHLDQCARIAAGIEPRPVDWADDLEYASAIEATFAGELGPWNDFERGLLYGKLSTLEWVLGCDNWDDEPRTKMRSAAAIRDRLALVAVQVWYDQYRNDLYEWLWDEKPVSSEVAEGAAENARRVREMYDEALLGPWSEYETGILNGRLSALRWLLGYDGDLLDD